MSREFSVKNPNIAKDKSGSDGTKRRLSSDGETPKSTPKKVKMAATRSPGKTGRSSKSDSFERDNDKFIEKMTIIADAVDNLQRGQSTLQSIVESKLDKFRNEFMTSID